MCRHIYFILLFFFLFLLNLCAIKIKEDLQDVHNTHTNFPIRCHQKVAIPSRKAGGRFFHVSVGNNVVEIEIDPAPLHRKKKRKKRE